MFYKRSADFFSRAWVHGRPKHDDRPALDALADCFARRNQRTKIGIVSVIHRRWHRDDDEIGLRQARRIVGRLQKLCPLQIIGTYFSSRVDMAPIGIDLRVRQIKTNGSVFLSEFHSKRQTHITQANNRDDSHDDSSKNAPMSKLGGWPEA